MSQITDYTRESLALSEMLAQLGLNDVIVKKRRRTYLVWETMETVLNSLMGEAVRIFVFGSQSEGTTTRGLFSDVDTVLCCCDNNVIRKFRDRKRGVRNLLMVDAEATPPGYCMLQVLRSDAPVTLTEINNENYFRERQVRIFLKNTSRMMATQDGRKLHGPALVRPSQNGRVAFDNVLAFPCTSQLPVVQQWLSVLHGKWPCQHMKRDIASCPCFVVPVGSRESVNEDFEWRISTSLAERCLMFSLNVTQLQVYVLMKMLRKTSINYNVPKESHISSFMCKTVVLHCVEKTAPIVWQSHMLIQCWLFSLFTLYVCVVNENCPHFIIRSNNLMARRFTQQAKYQLQENLRWLFGDIVSRGKLFTYIDKVADRLIGEISPYMSDIVYQGNDQERQNTCYVIELNSAEHTQGQVHKVLKKLTENRHGGHLHLLQQYVEGLKHVYRHGNEIERSACRLLIPYLYTALGSLLASESIPNSGTISVKAFDFFCRGLDSDVASSRLKLASVFFCAGEMERAEALLKDLKGRYDIHDCSLVCACTHIAIRTVLTRIKAMSLASDESDISKVISACVIFTQAEKNCTPRELQYELYRSTREDLQHRTTDDEWMDWAVVDSLPYLHFLCYKVYGRLQRRTEQETALSKFVEDIYRELSLCHKETALNLLGQCMEQENKWDHALKCYSRSLNIRPTNNAAKWHVCRLLYMRYRQCQD